MHRSSARARSTRLARPVAILAIAMWALWGCSSGRLEGENGGADSTEDSAGDSAADTAPGDVATDAGDARIDVEADALGDVDGGPDTDGGPADASRDGDTAPDLDGGPIDAVEEVADTGRDGRPDRVVFDPFDTGGGGELTVVFDGALGVSHERLDAALGNDGRIWLTGCSGVFCGEAVYICSFDAAARSVADFDRQCQSHGTNGAIFRAPRIAVDEAVASPEVAVVWDVDNHHAYGLLRDSGGSLAQQLLFDADSTSVNHPDVAFFDGEFWAVSQWWYAIGRVAFDALPLSSYDPNGNAAISNPALTTPVSDWDSCPSCAADVANCPAWVARTTHVPLGQEHKAPSIASGRMGEVERVAWVSYWGEYVYYHTCTADGGDVECPTLPVVVDGSCDAASSVSSHRLQAGANPPGRLEYPGRPGAAVDDQLNIHVAWHNVADLDPSDGENWQWHGLDYYMLPNTDLGAPLHLFLDAPFPLGGVDQLSPSVAVNEPGDVLVAFSSPAEDRIYLVARRQGEEEWSTGPEAVDSSRYPQTAAVASGDGFWLLYHHADGQVHAAYLDFR
jgi:hypothetical protein